jgi:hypothetical protein
MNGNATTNAQPSVALVDGGLSAPSDFAATVASVGVVDSDCGLFMRPV